MFGKSSFIGIITSLAAAGLYAEESEFKLEPLHSMASWEAGEVRSFVPDPSAAVVPGKNKHLINHAAVWLLQEARLSSNIKAFVGVGGMYFFILPSAGNQYSFGQRSAFGLTDAHGEFEFLKFGESDHGLLLKAGVFPFKYNSDAKNLGEYMYRTYTYPTVIFNGGLVLVNSAGVQLSGLDANTKIGGFNNDLLLTVKTDQVPSGSLSLTDIVSYTFLKFLTVGAGFMLDNFYDPTGLAKGTCALGCGTSDATYYLLKDGTVAYPSNPPADSLVQDTSHYTFVGQKAMVRLTLDFGKLIPGSLLSDQDLRVYFEGIQMGIKNYPGYYNNFWRRAALLAGFNFPTFHILDVLSFEAEFCRNPYVNSAALATRGLVPIPDASSGLNYRGDNFKWTVYARKTFYNAFSITGQAANDHLRMVDYFGHTNDQDVLQHRKNWYWALQLGYAL